MILVIDIGNTNIKYGVYKDDKLYASFRVKAEKGGISDEYGQALMNLLNTKSVLKSDIEGIIISSVKPSLNYTISHMCSYFFGIQPLMVGKGIKTGINIKADNPREVGADRIANCVSAYKKYGGTNLITIDFGTATTFNVITAKGEFIGGVIAPGIKGALESLVNGTAQLPMIELKTPDSVIAKDTVTNMQAGIIFGWAGLVENIVKKIKTELTDFDAKVIATGGLGEVLKGELNCVNVYDRTLTLDGLYYIYQLNK